MKIKLGMGGRSSDSKRLLPILGVLLLLIGAWFAWSAFNIWKDGDTASKITTARDKAANTVKAELTKQLKASEKAAADPAVVAAVQAGDYATASQALAKAWPGVAHAEVLAPDLQPLMADLANGGYGRAGVAQAALGGGKPAAAVVKDGKDKMLAVATPVGQGTALAIGSMPVKTLAGVLANAETGGGYLALKQGGAVIAEKGNAQLLTSGQDLSSPLKETQWTLAAASAPAAAGPLGLGLVPLAILAALGLLGGAALLFLQQRAKRVLQQQALVDSGEGVAANAAFASDDGLAEGRTFQELLAEQAPASVLAANAAAAAAPRVAAPRITAAADDGVPPPDAGIFRAYDIRGIVGKNLSVDVARQIGHAIGTVMHEQNLPDIVVGRDGRLSGPDLVGGLIEGLRRAGRNVINIGMAPTPLVYFGAYQLRTGCCVAVTGSHNPPDYNGFKIVVGGETLSGDAITALHRRIVQGALHQAEAPGRVEERDISEDYVQRIAADIRLERPLNVIVDAGNGVAGELGPRVLEAIGATVFPLFCEIDGSFPNHHPDPSEPHNLEDLRHMVKTRGADLGVAFDGDGDRLGVITPEGQNIFPDRLLMLFAQDVLERNPGAIIVYDVKCTGALAPFVMGHGGSPMMWKTGHSLIKAKMREEEAELAGEMSGHFFFMERWFGFDDGIYSAARLLEILAKRPDNADGVFSAIPAAISTPEIKVPVEDPHAFVAQLAAAADFPGARLTTIDGLRADWSDGWGLVRASNTTPVLVLRFEANSQPRLEEIQAEFRQRLQAVDPDVQLTF